MPWFDFYSRTLLTLGTPNTFYTSAYSDFMGSDGTIVIVSLDDNNADCTITITLNNCEDIVIPDPYLDPQEYTLTVQFPENTEHTLLTTAQYSTDGSTWTDTIPATARGDEIYLKVTYTDGVYSGGGQTFITRIAPLAEIYHPILPGAGTVTTSGTSTTISLGASP